MIGRPKRVTREELADRASDALARQRDGRARGETPSPPPLTRAEVERAVVSGVVKAIVWCVIVIPACFIVLMLGVTVLSGAFLRSADGFELQVGQGQATRMASPDTFEELVRGIRAHEYEEMDIYSDGRVAVRPRSGADIMFSLEPGVLERLKAQHVDYRRVDVHRKP